MDKLGKTLTQLVHDVYGTTAKAKILNVHSDRPELEARVVTVVVHDANFKGNHFPLGEVIHMLYIPAPDLMALYSCENMYRNFVSLAKEAGSLEQWELVFATAYVATGETNE